MKTFVIEQFAGLDSLVIKDVAQPEPEIGRVVFRVKAFGVNDAEMQMPWRRIRRGNPSGKCHGRPWTRHQRQLCRVHQGKGLQCVALSPAASNLGWDQLGAIPETYATAWNCLFQNLELSKGQRLLVRGGTSAFGRAAINLAVHTGAHVVATTRNRGRAAQLTALGVEKVVIEGENLSKQLPEKLDPILELVGNSTILDSLKIVHRGGRICLASFLVGLAPIPAFNPLLQMASGVQFNFFGSFALGTLEFPLSDVPLLEVVEMAASGELNAKPWKVFKFEDISEAHRMMENSEAQGKMIVVVD